MDTISTLAKIRWALPAVTVFAVALGMPFANAESAGAKSAGATSASRTFMPDPQTYRGVQIAVGATDSVGPTSAVGDEEIELSDEKKLSRWAFVLRRTIARSGPSHNARRVKKLATLTPDGTAEMVLLLRRHTDAEGAVWIKVRLPMRPNNTTGWVPRQHLGRYRIVKTKLLINTKTTRVTLYRSGRRVWSARIGVGTRQNPTPTGNFYVRSRLIPVKKNSIYGIFAFGLSAYSRTLSDWPGGGMIGVHGTNQPGLIPGRISHGCVRLRNNNIKRLKQLMSVGTPVEIK